MASRPTHRLKIINKATQATNEVGAGWVNQDGSVSLVLNVGTVLHWRDGGDCILTLFPIDRVDPKAVG